MNEQLEDVIMSHEWDELYDCYDKGSDDKNEIASKMELLKLKLEQAIAELRK